jgi:uncharacterized membrane protein YgaE (UPF0421/DUF939 family)
MTTGVFRWLRGRDNPTTLQHAAHTAVAAVLSLVIARLLRMPEAYWAPISTLIAMQSNLGASLAISGQRFVGTALGASVGALVAVRYPGNAVAFGIAVFAVGALCAAVSIDRIAYRYAGITTAIMILIAHSETVWITAVHRWIEVSVGLAVGVLLTATWPEQRSGS